jgi:hypothetical protein
LSANLDLVRSIYADWERGDFFNADWADPDIEFVIAGGPDLGTWAGVSAMSNAWRAWLSAWEDWTAEAEGCRELDHDRVLVMTTSSGRGKTTGLGVRQIGLAQGANLFRLRDNRVIRLVLYWDRDRAFADLGLTPEGDEASAKQRHRSDDAS